MTILDGGFGTMIQAAGLPAGKEPADWNVENSAAVTAVHRAYVEAGAQVVLTNTFGVNRLKYNGPHELGALIRAALANARASGAPRVALDIGPTGKLLRPSGDLAFDVAYEAFAEVIRLAVAHRTADADCFRPDLIFIETMSDVLELKAAVLAARENCDLPVFATVALGEDGRLLTGGSVECVAALLESLGVAAYGFNCGLSPDRMLPFVERLAKVSTRPIIVKPNAGMPRIVDGKTVFDVGPDEFSRHVMRLVAAGASIVGGCCGTTPEHIRKLKPIGRTLVSSGVEVVELKSHEGLIIGERINPTGKKLLREAYAKGDTAYVLREAVRQVDAGARILDVNCGVPGLDEAALLVETVRNVQSVARCPIQIDTANPTALERALRGVNGKPLVNSVNGSRESMDAVFPLVKKYGGTMVALCLDGDGIPATAEGRLAIARRILAEGMRYGFATDDFVFDALTLSVSTDERAALVTLETVRRLTDELHVNTVLGVSNVSFGLPNRTALNKAMYQLAVEAGLSAAIANPEKMSADVPREELTAATEVLLGRDPHCGRWIERHSTVEKGGESRKADSTRRETTLADAIVRGLKGDATVAARDSLVSGKTPLEIIETEIVPALETVGRGFEAGRVYLPQLLMSADAAGEAFGVVREALADNASSAVRRNAPIVLATVKGDVHDIGKNIVRALLENYGFDVIDLGRDVPPERIVAAVRDNHARLLGLSALMTTTVEAMAETIRQLKDSGLCCKTVVGGAVVTQEFADAIGADYYAKDAMRTVRIAEAELSSGA